MPEAYRQRFRTWNRKGGQTYVEFARDLLSHFKRWLSASDVTTFAELCDLIVLEQFQSALPVDHCQSTAYHPRSQGALERFHQTLKSLLRAYCTELDRNWEEGLPWLLLAAQENTGFSPNELIFEHSVQGPLAALKDGGVQVEPPKN